MKPTSSGDRCCGHDNDEAIISDYCDAGYGIQATVLVEAIAIARKTRALVWQNITFALVVKAIFTLLGIFGLATLWEAVFADVGVALVAILNATRALK